MTMSVGASGVWKQVQNISIGVSGVWKQVLNIWVGASGVWKLGYSALSDGRATVRAVRMTTRSIDQK